MSSRSRPRRGATTVEDRPSRARATALPPEERRAEIVAAALPLLLTHGSAVTTREIAEAAGVAEGTIFRVFPDKEHLIEAVVESAFDMQSVDAALERIEPTLPLEARLIEAVEILRRRFAEILQLRTAVEMMQLSSGSLSKPDRHHAPDLKGVAALFESSGDELRYDPMKAAYLLRGMMITGTHPSLILDEPLSSAEIVSLFLDGVRVTTTARPSDQREDRC